VSSLKYVVLTLAVAPVGACVIPRAQQEPHLPPGHNFSYSTEDREKVSLVQAFDDGTNTFLQFTETPSPDIQIRREVGEEKIAYTPEDRYLVLQGVYDRLRVTAAENSATVINQAVSAAPTRVNSMIDSTIPAQNPPWAATSITAGSVSIAPRMIRAPAVGIPESLQTMNAKLRVVALAQEIASLEDRVRTLVEQIEELRLSERGTHLYVRSVGGSPRFVVKFDDNSAEVRVDEGILENLGQAARAANRIYLHGHTDAYVASEAGTALAIQRAVEVRRLLISLNTEPQRIRMFYRGAGDFVANNSTPGGKAFNRRVEIELRKW
jgi:outer membrane protein OmpA-like peptidoglycan-associated protein